MNAPTFAEWIAQGQRLGYLDGSFCAAHDLPPMSEPERELFDSGDDPCLPSMRLGSDE